MNRHSKPTSYSGEHLDLRAPSTRSKRGVLVAVVGLVVACGSVAAPEGFSDVPAPPAPSSGGQCAFDCSSRVDVTVPALTPPEAATAVIVACVDETCVEQRLPKTLADRGQCGSTGTLAAFECAYRIEGGKVSLALRFSSRGVNIVPSTLFTVRLERDGDRGLLFGAGPSSVAQSKSPGCNGKTCWSGTLALTAPDAGIADASAD